MERSVISIPRQAGLYVRRAREERGLTRAQLARAADVSERLVASLELGEAPGVRLEKLMAVLGALDMRLEVSWETNVDSNDLPYEVGMDMRTTSQGTAAEVTLPEQKSAPSHGEAYRRFIFDEYGVFDDQRHEDEV